MEVSEWDCWYLVWKSNSTSEPWHNLILSLSYPYRLTWFDSCAYSKRICTRLILSSIHLPFYQHLYDMQPVVGMVLECFLRCHWLLKNLLLCRMHAFNNLSISWKTSHQEKNVYKVVCMWPFLSTLWVFTVVLRFVRRINFSVWQKIFIKFLATIFVSCFSACSFLHTTFRALLFL